MAEVKRYAEEFPDRILKSIYFGGGTPSLMDPQTVAAILSEISHHWRLANDIEITLEANPNSVEVGRFQQYRDAGVNRASLGIQALNDEDLQKLGRLHSAVEAQRALDVANSIFDRTSFDLIYARQHQSIEDWEAELKQALTMENGHVSLYQLTIEPGTSFGDRYRRGMLKGLPDDDASADMFDLTNDICASHGLTRYEVSNFASRGNESRHNQIYWRYGDYIGIGPGAHGRLTDPSGRRIATETALAPSVWLAATQNPKHDAETRIPLSRLEQGAEMLLMGLRLAEGIDFNRYESLAGKPLSHQKVQDLIYLGAIDVSKNRLRVTDTHVGVLNSILDKLLSD